MQIVGNRTASAKGRFMYKYMYSYYMFPLVLSQAKFLGALEQNIL